MNWVEENWVNILAVVGGLYTAARTVVLLTPTPKDDAYLEKASVWLKTVAKVIGLDLKQGRKE